MALKQFISIFILASLVYSCANNPSKVKLINDNKYFSIQIINKGPTGASYLDATKKVYQYRCLIASITNDTLMPVNLQIEFLDAFISLSPFKENKYKVFLLPDSMKSEKQYDANSNLSKEFETFLRKQLYTSTIQKVIKPGETYKVRLGFLFDISGGQTCAELFSKGHKNNLSIPEKEIKINSDNKKAIDLMLGVTLNSKNANFCYSTITCGQLYFSK